MSEMAFAAKTCMGHAVDKARKVSEILEQGEAIGYGITSSRGELAGF